MQGLVGLGEDLGSWRWEPSRLWTEEGPDWCSQVLALWWLLGGQAVCSWGKRKLGDQGDQTWRPSKMLPLF